LFKEYVIKNDVFALTVVPQFGCHWTSLRLCREGRAFDLLLPVPDHVTLVRKPSHFGNYLLAPWSNRISRGLFTHEHQEHRLRKNSPDHTAIHGDVRMRPWSVVRADAQCLEAVLDSRDCADFNYPFPFEYRHGISINGSRLTAGMWIKNLGERRAPAGMGFHPYFVRRLTSADPDVELTLPAEKVYPALRCIPTGPAIPVSGHLDLRPRTLLGRRNLDHCYTSMKPGPVKILYPGTGVEIDLRMDMLFNHVVVYAPDTWWGWGPSRPFFCVEPVTHANDGFNLFAKGWEGTGVKELEPGESWGGSFELNVNWLH
jgi:aldose 1-epimerase